MSGLAYEMHFSKGNEEIRAVSDEAISEDKFIGFYLKGRTNEKRRIRAERRFSVRARCPIQ